MVSSKKQGTMVIQETSLMPWCKHTLSYLMHGGCLETVRLHALILLIPSQMSSQVLFIFIFYFYLLLVMNSPLVRTIPILMSGFEHWQIPLAQIIGSLRVFEGPHMFALWVKTCQKPSIKLSNCKFNVKEA